MKHPSYDDKLLPMRNVSKGVSVNSAQLESQKTETWKKFVKDKLKTTSQRRIIKNNSMTQEYPAAKHSVKKPKATTSLIKSASDESESSSMSLSDADDESEKRDRVDSDPYTPVGNQHG